MRRSLSFGSTGRHIEAARLSKNFPYARFARKNRPVRPVAAGAQCPLWEDIANIRL